MSAKKVYLFADTNLFIQCPPIETLPWSDLNEFDEIELIVTSPVIKEVDNQKNKRGDRVGNKARATNSLFREIVTGKIDHKIVSASAPQVKLFLKPEYLYKDELQSKLNLSEADDQLVAIIHNYKNENPSADVRLFTDDTGPMAKAKMLDVSFIPIPENWILSPENSDEEKKVIALQEELLRLKKQEPDIEIQCLDQNKNLINKLEFEKICYQPLTDDEIEELLEVIKTRNPLKNDFGSREATERVSVPHLLSFDAFKEVYIPATDEEIQKYCDGYSTWLEECREFLRKYHHRLQYHLGNPKVCFVAENQGVRPAKDALIRFEAMGNFEIMPPHPVREEEREEFEKKGKDISLPAAPRIPHGRWQSKTHDFFSVGKSMQDYMSMLSPHHLSGRDLIPPGLFSPPRGRDPNEFYYKPERPYSPCDSFELECEQWRHADGAEHFVCEIYIHEETGNIAGCLECSVHAENLTQRSKKSVPVRISIKQESAKAQAMKMIENSIIVLNLK